MQVKPAPKIINNRKPLHVSSLTKKGHWELNSHIENLLLESLPGNNLTPRDLKSTDRFTAEENRAQEKGEKSDNRLDKV